MALWCQVGDHPIITPGPGEATSGTAWSCFCVIAFQRQPSTSTKIYYVKIRYHYSLVCFALILLLNHILWLIWHGCVVGMILGIATQLKAKGTMRPLAEQIWHG